jgi:hypothetical protein
MPPLEDQSFRILQILSNRKHTFVRSAQFKRGLEHRRQFFETLFRITLTIGSIWRYRFGNFGKVGRSI